MEKEIPEQLKILHASSPELYDNLLDIIQDAQSIGSIVQIVTIIPPFLMTNEDGEIKYKPYSGGCSPNSPKPMFTPENTNPENYR